MTKRFTFYILFFIFMYACKSSENERNNVVLTLKMEKVFLTEFSKNEVVVFANTIGCHDCFLEVKEVMANIKNTLKNDIKVIAILPKLESNAMNKQASQRIYKLLNQDTTFYDIIESVDDNIHTKSKLFQKYNIQFVPTLLLIKDGKELLINSEQIFRDVNNGYEKLNTIIYNYFKI